MRACFTRTILETHVEAVAIEAAYRAQSAPPDQPCLATDRYRVGNSSGAVPCTAGPRTVSHCATLSSTSAADLSALHVSSAQFSAPFAPKQPWQSRGKKGRL